MGKNTDNTRAERIKYAFGAHPSVKELHVSSDDQMFLTASDAQNHANTLENKDVETVHRKDYVKSVEAPAVPNQLDLEKEALKAKYLELFGKAAAPNASIEKLKNKIQNEETKRANEAEELAKQQGVESSSGSDKEE